MSTATATQDEDLLIISEDTSENSNDIDFSFHFGDDVSTESNSTLEVAQTDSLTSEVTLPSIDEGTQTNAALGDFSFDVFSDTAQTPVSDVQNDVSI